MAALKGVPDAKIEKTTLSVLGSTLPVGSASGARDMVCRPWRLKEEREIGALRERMKKSPLGDFVAAVIGSMFTRLADLDLEKLAEPERLVRISHMPIADVLYAYAWLRRDAMGPGIDVTVTCSECGHDSKITASLEDLDVKTCKPDRTWKFTLSTPTPIRGAPATVLTLQPPLWESMRKVAGKTNIGNAKAEIIRSSIKQVDDRAPFPLLVEDLDELRKVDVEGLAGSVDQESPGPDFAVHVSCESCGAQIKTSLDWGYDAFFSRSSSR